MSATDYEKKFSELVQHVPLFCDHEVQKSKRFEVGLRKEVKSILASVSHTQYEQVVEAATRIERSLGLAPHISQVHKGQREMDLLRLKVDPVKIQRREENHHG